MSLSDVILADAQTVYCDPLGIAEPVVYTAKGAAPLPLNLPVFRAPPAPVMGAGGGGIPAGGNAAPMLQVFIPKGVGVAAITKNADTITVAERIGGTAIPHPVVEILGDDVGGWLLKLR